MRLHAFILEKVPGLSASTPLSPSCWWALFSRASNQCGGNQSLLRNRIGRREKDVLVRQSGVSLGPDLTRWCASDVEAKELYGCIESELGRQEVLFSQGGDRLTRV